MPHRECSPKENVLRAILTAHWDENKKRLSSDLFKGENISVSRLSVLGITDLFAIFHLDLDSQSKNHFVVGGGEINIGRLQEIGRSFLKKPTELTVVEAPTANNPAHAEIPQKITRGLALEIIKAMTLHRDPLSYHTNSAFETS